MVPNNAESAYLTRLLKRVMAKVRKLNSGCWTWRGATAGGKYGVITVRNRPVNVRRLLYFLRYVKGSEEVEEGAYELVNTCGNRSCINPDHLEVGGKKKGGRR